MISPGLWRLICPESFLFPSGQSSVVDLLLRGPRHVANTLKEPSVVEPVRPFERGELDVFEALPRTPLSDELGLDGGHEALGGVDALMDRQER